MSRYQVQYFKSGRLHHVEEFDSLKEAVDAKNAWKGPGLRAITARTP